MVGIGTGISSAETERSANGVVYGVRPGPVARVPASGYGQVHPGFAGYPSGSYYSAEPKSSYGHGVLHQDLRESHQEFHRDLKTEKKRLHEQLHRLHDQGFSKQELRELDQQGHRALREAHQDGHDDLRDAHRRGHYGLRY